MARSRDIQKKASQSTSGGDGLDLCRHGFRTIEPEIKWCEKRGRTQRVHRRRADKAMNPLGIPEGADELTGVSDPMEFCGGGVGTINGNHGKLGRPGQWRE